MTIYGASPRITNDESGKPSQTGRTVVSDAYLQRSFSQDGEDRLLLKAVGQKRHGFYVDVGAYHPFRFSNTALLYELGWRGINIDATPGVKDQFDFYRPDDINVHIAVADYKGSVDLQTFAEGAYNTAVRKRIPKNIEWTGAVSVPCDTLNAILERSLPENKSIDVLDINIEGLDQAALEDFDFDRYGPCCVVVEDPALDISCPDSSKLFRVLSDAGYALRFKTFRSAIYWRDPGTRLKRGGTHDMSIHTLLQRLDDKIWSRDGDGGYQHRSKRAVDGRRRLNAALRTGSIKVACGGVGRSAFRIGETWVEPVQTDDEPDVAIFSSHVFVRDSAFSKTLRALQERLPNLVTAVYMRDNHHMYSQNLWMARQVDFVAPGHFYKNHYIRSANLNVLEPVPMAVGQFGSAFAERLYNEYENIQRSDALYGGFGFYKQWPERVAFIDDLGKKIKGSKVVQWRESEPSPYYNLSKEEAFIEWMSHKVSVIVNTDFCIPQRLFDALIAGHIPIVPKGLPGLDRIISPEDQRALPIVFYDEMAIESAERAYRYALELFDAGSLEAARFRHEFARQNHMMHGRFRLILQRMIAMSSTVL